MQVINNIYDAKNIEEPIALALGNFDGVHRGHQALIEECVSQSKCKGWIPSAMTFHPHPRQVLGHGTDLKLINTQEQKVELMQRLGLEYLFLLPFNLEIASLSPIDFVKKYLLEVFQVKKLFVGFNYTFGQGGRGTPDILHELGRGYGFEVQIIKPVTMNRNIVSSTLIRKKYTQGDIRGAAGLLGYWPVLASSVTHGYQRGRLIGFPTANLRLPPDLILPAFGVYASWAQIEDKLYPAIINIGVKPTFTQAVPSGEVHIFDFSGDLYGKYIKVHLIQWIRAERPFNNINELGKQISLDCKKARQILVRPERYFLHKIPLVK